MIRDRLRSGLPGWLWRLLLCMLITQVAVFVVRPVLTYRVIDLGGGELEVGLLVAAYALLPALVAIPIGRYSDRRRSTPVLLGGILLLVAGCAGLVVASDLVVLVAATIILGLGAMAIMIGAQTLVAALSDEHSLDRDFGLISAAASVGQMIGPALGGAVLSGGAAREVTTTRAFVIGALLSAAALIFCWGFADSDRRSRPGPPGDEVAPGPIRILRLPGVFGGMFASLALLTAVDVLVAYLPLLGERRGIGAATIGALLSLRAAASVASRVLIPPMLARWGRVRLLLMSTLGSGVLMALLPLTNRIWLLGLVLVAAGFFLGIGQPLTMALVVQAVPARTRGAALSIRIMGNKIGQVLVPAGIGVATGAAGASWAFPFLGLLLVASAVGVPRSPPAEPEPPGSPRR
ncbi:MULTISPECIES: MFS transporter [unclassified Micromonospora]|uniref:MFS transporter n=1 Tax=unclassified Micromonospora TaxID=2617518 RepID=UPI003A839FE1